MPWNEQVSRLGGQLVAGRHETVAALQPRFAERAGELGLGGAQLRYEGEPPSPEQLEARTERDLERGTTGLGPHLDDVLSELDPGRRRILGDRLRAAGQALVTSACRNSLPGEPAQTLEVAQSSDGTSTAKVV